MTKTKKQLRAEAVERLRKLEGKAASYADYCKAMVDCPDGFLGQVAVTQIIDLLTDDDANDDSTPEKVVSSSEPFLTPLSNPNETGNGDDSREKLEADVRKIAGAYNMDTQRHGTKRFEHELFHSIIHLLNRQRAIDDSICDDCSSDFYKLQEAYDALEDEVDKLTAERDKLQEQLLIGWECECRLQTEREHYREKFGKCLDYADAIHALMDDEGMA